MSLGEWASSSLEARRVMLDSLLERLPEWLELVDATSLRPRFRDRRFGDGWRLFPSGRFEMGATSERLERLATLQALHPMRLAYPEVQLPAQPIEVSSFLLMEDVVLEGGEPRYLFMDVEKEVTGLLVSRGVRLPTEAEWEFAWRSVSSQPEGWTPREHELCADGWRSDLAAFSGRDPLLPGGPSVLRMASLDPDSFEHDLPARAPLTAVRMATIRAALDVPRSSVDDDRQGQRHFLNEALVGAADAE